MKISFACLFFITWRIAYHDFKTHYIRDLDLLVLLIPLAMIFKFHFNFALLYLAVLLAFNLISKGSIGFGDVKLGFVLGSSIHTFMQFVIVLDAAWIIGGVWGLFRRKASIPFAPAMIIGSAIGQLFI
jgi:hypothetical protein